MSEPEQGKPPRDAVLRVLSSFLVVDPDRLLAPLSDVEAGSQLPAAFIEDALGGLRSVTSAGTLPYQLVCHSVQQRRFDGLHTAERIRSLQPETAREPLSQEAEQKVFQIANQRMNEFVRSDEGTTYFRDAVVFDLDQRLASRAVAEAASELLVQTLVSTWAVFESSVRSFIKNWINANPTRAQPVLVAPDLKSYFGKQVVDIAVIGDHGFDLTASMGDILFRERRLDHLGVIRSVLEALFNDQHIRDALGGEMWMLNQRRHLFVHKRGFVDDEYLGRTGDSVSVGERLRLTSGDVEHYIGATQDAVIAIALAAEREIVSAMDRG